MKKDENQLKENIEETKSLKCGLIMPISTIDGCSAEHWVEVKSIVSEAVELIKEYDFKVRLVSEADDSGVIQKRIVQNIYGSDIIICDVSGKNPNVMFELGMRLAFDKPTVIIKDDLTDYSFDTSIIEHVPYPRDLRFRKIVEFKKSLAAKVKKTYEASLSDPDHSPFLKNFGRFHVATISETVISSDKMIIEMLSDLQKDIMSLRRSQDIDIRKRDGSITVRAYSKISESLNKYMDTYSIEDISNLLGDRTFYSFVEEEIDARQYFDSAKEFEYVLEKFLKNMIQRGCDIKNFLPA